MKVVTRLEREVRFIGQWEAVMDNRLYEARGRLISRIAGRVEITACLEEYLWHRSTCVREMHRGCNRDSVRINSAPREYRHVPPFCHQPSKQRFQHPRRFPRRLAVQKLMQLVNPRGEEEEEGRKENYGRVMSPRIIRWIVREVKVNV